MPKLTIDDLREIRDKVKSSLDVERGPFTAKITVHMGTCGISAGATPVLTALQQEVAASGRQDIHLTQSGCAGLCSQEPMVTVQMKGREPIKYVFVDKDKAVEIFKAHVLGGQVVFAHGLAQGSEEDNV